jgi:cytochrome P450
METLGLKNLCVTDVCGRMTLDAIGVAGFGKKKRIKLLYNKIFLLIQIRLGFDFECVSVVDNKWLKGYDNIRDNFADLFFILFQIFDDELKWMFPHRVSAHKDLDRLLANIDNVITEKKAEMAINGPSSSKVPAAEKDILTLMLEAELQGEGKLSDLELRVCILSSFANALN